jgi:peptidoglycan/LPS O-acetylase OafA/YrhL
MESVMFGVFRLGLALLVVLSHLGYRLDGFHIGVPAVVGFYLLSGYFVAYLYERNSASTPLALWSFYRDRALRILPLYYYVCLLTVIFILVGHYTVMSWTWGKAVAHATIIPLNFYMYIDTRVFPALRMWLVPSSWSLGAELQFYLLFPLFARFRRVRQGVMLGSCMLFWAAAFGLVNTDWYTYRLVPGTVFIFIAGMLLYYEKHLGSRLGIERYVGIVIWGSTIVGLALVNVSGRARVPYVTEVLCGLILGYPIVRWLVWHAQLTRTDDMFGSLAYGAFLSHFLVIWAYSATQGRVTEAYAGDPLATGIILAGTLGLAFLGYYCVDRPMRLYRRSLRAKSEA